MKKTIALLALSGIVSHTLARSTYPILLPAIEGDLLSGHQQSGLLTTANFAAYMAAVAVVTTVSGWLEPVRILKMGILTAAIGFVLLARAQGFGGLAIGQALAGFGSAGIWMTAPSIATSTVAANRRGTVMGLISSTMGLGIIVSSQGTRLYRQAAGDDELWRPTWVAAAVFAFALLALIVAGLRTPTTATISGGVSLSRLRTVPGWLPLTVGYVLFGLVISSFNPFFGAALEDHDFSRSHIANLYSLFGVAAVFAAVGFGRVSDRVGRRPVLLGAVVVLLVASLLVLTGREPFATIAALAFGAASFTFPVLVAAYLSDHLKDRAFSNAFGALTLIYSCSLVIGPSISGTVGDSRFGFEAVFIGVAVCAGLAAMSIRAIPVDREAITVSPRASV